MRPPVETGPADGGEAEGVGPPLDARVGLAPWGRMNWNCITATGPKFLDDADVDSFEDDSEEVLGKGNGKPGGRVPLVKASDDGNVGDELERERRDEPVGEPLPPVAGTDAVEVEKNCR